MSAFSVDDELWEVYHPAPRPPGQVERLVLPVDKPHGWSSFKVIRRLRHILGIRKVGHAGTLDPMATGLLICLVGRATKMMERFMELPKEYTGVIRLGEETASFDAETDVTTRHSVDHVTAETLEDARFRFLGDIEQLPPMYSAVKIGGERLYKKARRGEEIERKARRVRIDEFSLLDVEIPEVAFRVRCSKGTYIRSLAHDFGQATGAGGHLSALRRTAIGPFRVEDAWSIDALERAMSDR